MTDVVTASQRALDSVFNRAGKPFVNRVLTTLTVSKCIVLTGVGKSFALAQLGASLFQSVGFNATATHATDLLHGGLGPLQRREETALVALSHSGKTREVLDVCDELVNFPCYVIAITGDPESRLVAYAHHQLTYDAPMDGSRHGTVPTVSTTAQLAWLNVVACAHADNTSLDVMAARHPGGSLARVYVDKFTQMESVND